MSQLSEQELQKRMSPEDFERYKQYSALKDKFQFGSLRDVTKDEWDAVNKLLFKASGQLLKLPQDLHLSLKVSGKGIEKEPEAKIIVERMKIKFDLLLDAIRNFSEEDQKCLPPNLIEALNAVISHAEYPMLKLPDDVLEKVLRHGIRGIHAKLKYIDDPELMSHKWTVLDSKIVKELLDVEIKSMMPKPTEAELLKEVESHFEGRGRPWPMR